MTSANNNIYQIEVVKVSGLNPLTKSLRFKFASVKQGKAFAFIPGQFIMLGVLGYGEAALTITTTPEELPEFEVAVRSIGNATKAMHRLKAGDKAYFRGAFGNSTISRKIFGQELLLIAGGIGLAPLRSIIHAVRDDKTIVGKLALIYGAKTPEELIYKGELGAWSKFAEVVLTVDKADREWTGKIGRVSDALKKTKVDKDAVAVVCGPPVMYPAIAEILIEKGLAEENIEFMLERRMKCGIGKCQHCTCGEKYVCLDGPTFTWKDIKDNWEAML